MTERPAPLSFADLGISDALRADGLPTYSSAPERHLENVRVLGDTMYADMVVDIPSEIPMVETEVSAPLSWADLEVKRDVENMFDPILEMDGPAPPRLTGSVECDASLTLEGPEARRFIDTVNEHLATYANTAPAPIAPVNRAERKVRDRAWTDEAAASLIAYRRAVRSAKEKRAKRARAMRAARLARRKGRRS